MAERRGVAERSTVRDLVGGGGGGCCDVVVAGIAERRVSERHREGTWRQTGGRAPALARPRESRQSGAHLSGADSGSSRGETTMSGKRKKERDIQITPRGAAEPVHFSSALISRTGARPVPLSESPSGLLYVFHLLFIPRASVLLPLSFPRRAKTRSFPTQRRR